MAIGTATGASSQRNINRESVYCSSGIIDRESVYCSSAKLTGTVCIVAVKREQDVHMCILSSGILTGRVCIVTVEY